MKIEKKKNLIQDSAIPPFITEQEERYFEKGPDKITFIFILFTEIVLLEAAILGTPKKQVKYEAIIMLILIAVTIGIYFCCTRYYAHIWKQRLRAEKEGQCIEGWVARIEEQFEMFARGDISWYRVHVEYDDLGDKKKWISPHYRQNPALFIEEEGKCRLLKYGRRMYLDRSFRGAIKSGGSTKSRTQKMTLKKFHKANKSVLKKKYILGLPFFLIGGAVMALKECIDSWNSVVGKGFLVFGIFIGIMGLAAGIVWPVYSYIKLKKANMW